MRFRSSRTCAGLAAWVLACALGAQAGLRVEVARVSGPASVTLDGGHELRLLGLDLPDPVVRPVDAERRLVSFLRRKLEGRQVWLQPASAARGGGAVRLSLAAGGRSVNEQALEQGLALFHDLGPGSAGLQGLPAASERARKARRGLFGAAPKRHFGRPPYLNGAVIGLHYEDARYDYKRQIDELAKAGFRHVSFLFPVFVENVEASTIIRDHRRTLRDGLLLETIRRARAKGMSVMLLPIVLLLEAGDDDWRGTLHPADPDRFWREYDRFLTHYLDIAEATGVEIFSIGSELGSLESDTEAWIRIIRNARGRFAGLLTYSANWDHVQVPRFFAHLDLVGMTAYFSLTDKRDPTMPELVSAWRKRGLQIARAVRPLGRPVIFTELGYASQDGINQDPWNYLMNKARIDLSEQAQCFEAFLKVAPEMEFLAGAYFYDYFGRGGPTDHGYSPRGKPAMEQWKRWAGYRPPSAGK